MGVVRGKIFHDAELVTVTKTDGHWPLKKNDDGTWTHTETGETYEAVTIREALRELDGKE